jgi:hypothetical protein
LLAKPLTMKRVFLLLITLITYYSVSAQNWLWAKEATPLHNGWGDVTGDHTTLVDALGNVYSAGIVYDTISFGPYVMVGNTNYGHEFIVKYDALGNLQWATQGKPASLISRGEARSMCFDGSGNIYLAGLFYDTLTFGSYVLKSTNFNQYIAKYDVNGNPIWAVQGRINSSVGFARIYGIVSDSPKYLYTGGIFRDTILVGADTLISSNNYVNCDTYVAKYDTSGKVIWARQAKQKNTKGNVRALSASGDAQHNLYIGGYFNDTISFGAKTIISKSPYADVFVTKYDSGGNVQWVSQGKSSFSAMVASIATDAGGSTYLTGYFQDTITFDTIKLISKGINCPYLVKYNTDGSVVWAIQPVILDGNNWDGLCVTCDTLKQGGCYWAMTGGGKSPQNIRINSTPYSLATSYLSATVLVHLDSTGTIKCGTIFTDGGEDDMDAIGVDRAGSYVYIGADEANPVLFGPDSLLYSYDNPFVARWDNCNLIITGNKPISNVQQVFLFPNPNNGLFTLQSNKALNGCNVEIYNMTGEKVYSAQFSAHTSQFTVDLNNKPAGIYLYRLLDKEGQPIANGKFVIE